MDKKYYLSLFTLFFLVSILTACTADKPNGDIEQNINILDQTSEQAENTDNPAFRNEDIIRTINYTLEEVNAHNTKEDCWLAIGGKVYDVTNFIASGEHNPAILQGCGLDATELFTTRPMGPKTDHPASAYLRLETLYIGELN